MKKPQSVIIHDTDTPSEAEILVGFGFNCFRFQTTIDDQFADVLWADDDFASGCQRPSGSGIPILFPFPGRIQGTVFPWDGRCYALEDGDGMGNAIHGFVHSRPWRVVECSDQSVVGQFQPSIDDRSLLDKWPSDYCLQAEYRLRKRRLEFNCRIENCGDLALPCGLGTHPYFRMPPIGQGAADDCRVRIPVSASWELVGMNATGKLEPLADAEEFQSGRRFADLQLDNVLSGLIKTDGIYQSSIVHPQTGITVRMEFSDVFRECVVYTPRHRQAICIEPYTCVPDAFRLEREGVDAGLHLLRPGEFLSAEIAIEVDRSV